MPHIDSHAPGTFCWMELATTDQDAAKKFYSELFGWTPADVPIGPSDVYTMFKLEGRDAAAGYTMRQEDRDRGVPPHWMLYISSDDVNASAQKVRDAGGKVLADPFDVMTFGKMAVIQDPTGAIFAIWQPVTHLGIGIKDQHGTFCWSDLMSPDSKRAQDFYGQVFGWKLVTGENDSSGYLHILNGEKMIGGMPPSEHQPPNTPPHWLLYFLAQNCEESTGKLKELGGRVHAGPMTIPNVGRMSIVADPQGAVFALFEPSPNQR